MTEKKKQSWKEKLKQQYVESEVKKKGKQVQEKAQDIITNPKEHTNNLFRKIKTTTQGIKSEAEREANKSFVFQSIKGTVQGIGKTVKHRKDLYVQSLENRAKADEEDTFAKGAVKVKDGVNKTLYKIVSFYDEAKEQAAKAVTNEHIMPGYDNIINTIEKETTKPGTFTKEYTNNSIDFLINKAEEKTLIGKNNYTLHISTNKIEEGESGKLLCTANLQLNYKPGEQRNDTRVIAKIASDVEDILKEINTEQTTKYQTNETINITLDKNTTIAYHRTVSLNEGGLQISYTPKNKNNMHVGIAKLNPSAEQNPNMKEE